MHTLLFRFVLTTPILLLALPVHGGDDVTDHMSERAASWFSDGELRANTRTDAAVYQSNFTPTYFRLPDTGGRLRDLTPETDRPRTQGYLASTTWLKGTVTTETEVASNQGGN